jgi:hypothetical protein
MSAAPEAAALAQAQRVLTASWREGEWIGAEAESVEFGFSCPSPTHYPWQWYWDSCFHAICRRRFDREKSRKELESLLAAMRPDGFIGHTIFWNTPIDRLRRFTYNIDSPTSPTTSTMQPPLLAWAWKICGLGEPSDEPRIAQHHEWLRSERDLDGDGLLWIIQPDESGIDSSPKFEETWGYRAHGHLGFPLLLRQNRRLDWSARKIADAGHPVVCELIVNVLWGLSLLASGEESITPRIVERFWDEDRGLFLDVVRKGSKERQVDISTWTALAPLALPDLPEEIGRRLVDEHLLASDGYWTPVPVPSVAVSEPEFEPRKWKSGPIRRYWMGPSWGNSAWLIWLGLNRLGYEKEAAEMEKAWLGCYVREGSWEFYEPYSGEGMGARDFGWTSLVAEFADPDPLGLTSWV